MSENIPNSSNAKQQNTKKSTKRKIDTSKLPTPPPDPNESKPISETKSKENKDEFLAYLDSLHSSGNPSFSRSVSAFAPAIITEDAFDHLEKLYKLMEQMLELREQNARLHRRVRDLEHLNNLEKMHKQINISSIAHENCPELDKDTAFAETILESILSETKVPKLIKPASVSTKLIRQSILRKQRNRSGSAIDKAINDSDELNMRRASISVDDRLDKPAKVSKWTKVKAAFKWEKASSTVGDAKSQDSGIGGMVPVNLEVARYLRVPSTGEETGHSPADSGAAETSTPGTLSTASSTEDFHRNDLKTPCEDLKSSDEEHSHSYIPRSKEGSQKSNRSFKTPWAKMKDIINTRSSFKKKHRLSSHSDDIQIDIEFCSDNEEVFEDENKYQTSNVCSSSPIVYSKIYKRVDSSEIPPDVIERYKKAVEDDGRVAENLENKKISKWTRVKKAFLTPNENKALHTTPPPLLKEYIRSDIDFKSAQEEIQKSYKQLQKKLSLEFQEKLNEWERMKQNSPGTSNPSSSCGFVDDNHDPAFIKKMEEWQKMKAQPQLKNLTNFQMQSEENLPPEFRKKLEEWKKIKKHNVKENITTSTSQKKKLGEVPKSKSLSGQKSDNSPTSTSPLIEYPVISEDFRKKLEEWKQIKAVGCAATFLDESSPRFNKKSLSPKYHKKHKDHKDYKDQDKELQWFEKELSKIEKEKQRLEKERQKFLEREERLSKLRSAIIGSAKKEVFIHTPSGFHRFEGISKKFTQKLYEWEKTQGIGPESSTFALLCGSELTSKNKNTNNKVNTSPLVRSKSADSIVKSVLNLACPLMSHQPSSLSLNNMDDLEKECLSDSKSSSMRFLDISHESLNEPEALIVEIEDIVEETAAPLCTVSQTKQLPIYQREEIKALCEGQMCMAPKIRRIESKRAQSNYNLIEEILGILNNLCDNEMEIDKIQDLMVEYVKEQNYINKLKEYNDSQKYLSDRMTQKIHHLQDANNKVVSNINKENSAYNDGHAFDILEAVQDLSNELLHLSDKISVEINQRNLIDNQVYPDGAKAFSSLVEICKEICTKILDLRRKLSYLCAASDLTAPGRKRSNVKKSTTHKGESSEKNLQEGRLYIKSETSNIQSQGAIKKKIKYRQKNLQHKGQPSPADTDDDEDNDDNFETRRNKHKKLTRTRSISESGIEKLENDLKSQELKHHDDTKDKKILNAKTSIASDSNSKIPESPISLFIKTTRKLFTPLVESEFASTDDKKHNKIKETPPNINILERNKEISEIVNKLEKNRSCTSIAHLPPLPSPTPQRKVPKEISPGIRLMLAKYNQKLSEQDLATSSKSGGSSGSASPVAWRSPTSERRVKAQTERYQKELTKLSPLLGERREVKKSASAGYLSSNKQVTMPRRDSIQHDIENETSGELQLKIPKKNEKFDEKKKDLKLNIDLAKDLQHSYIKHSPEIRMRKLKKAKEEFLKSAPASMETQSIEEVLKFPQRNRLSQISVDSESSFDSTIAGVLVKSVSAGMINIDPDTYKQFDPETHGGGYVSLPRSPRKQKEGLLNGKFAFSNIASKFRKVKMRRNREREKSGAVSALCRQSLVVDINLSGESSKGGSKCSSPTPNVNFDPDDSSINSSKSNWILKRPKLFKKL